MNKMNTLYSGYKNIIRYLLIIVYIYIYCHRTKQGITLHYIKLYYNIFNNVLLYSINYTILYLIIFYSIVLYYIILYYIILSCVVLYFIILYCFLHYMTLSYNLVLYYILFYYIIFCLSCNIYRLHIGIANYW